MDNPTAIAKASRAPQLPLSNSYLRNRKKKNQGGKGVDGKNKMAGESKGQTKQSLGGQLHGS